MPDTTPGETQPPIAEPAPPPPSDDELSPGSVPEDDPLGALREEIALIVEDARTYAEAEVQFQKTRAAIAGKASARALVLLVLALVLLNIALIALAVGAVFALAPLVGTWGAIVIVVGALLLGVAGLVLAARRDGALIAALFDPGKDGAA